ncbi:hypothetical protein [Calderihabitans maritimus]|uniref:Uncharacterized protein n=1 Tax=Calderihabitans maritimus TaxID=1246530 RepID=A0A1Z5HSZ1_9FIRM|nr:hypothetical protein [Calderihabitans maritimus]GAW92652.1 hypothetical protein KKC1_18030 [Calderihabitans maritimus]
MKCKDCGREGVFLLKTGTVIGVYCGDCYLPLFRANREKTRRRQSVGNWIPKGKITNS